MNFKKLTAVTLASVFALGASFSAQPKAAAASEKSEMVVAIDAIKKEMETNRELKEIIEELKNENKSLRKASEGKKTSFRGMIGNLVKYVGGIVLLAVAVDTARELEAGEFVLDVAGRVMEKASDAKRFVSTKISAWRSNEDNGGVPLLNIPGSNGMVPSLNGDDASPIL